VGNDFAHSVAGCAIMFSNGLDVRGNDFRQNRGPRTYGLLLRDCSAGTFADNRFFDNTIAIFFDNSNRNHFDGNLIQDNGWGVLLFASCAGNEFSGNAFVHNDYPVALDMRRTQNRFDDGAHGNYWSEARPYDLDGDGVSDAPHAPVDAFSFLSKRFPDLSVLARSPAVAALGVAERVLPALQPSDALDRFPLRRPPRVRGTGRPLALPVAPGAATGAAAGFAALGVLGAVGLGRAALGGGAA
jgi:nitrous oxidase accessory protein